MADPLAFLLTFRTYGTWLHGDERGSVDRNHNGVGMPYLAPDPRRAAAATARMSAPALELTEDMRKCVAAALADQCAYRAWQIIACAVRSNHVHIAVAFSDVRPERMAQELKARATRWLRERQFVGPTQPVWAEGPGSRRYLWRPEHVTAAVEYVREGQDVPR